MIMEKVKVIVPILLVIGYTAMMLLSAHFVQSSPRFSVSENGYIDFQFNYQLLLLMVTGISLLTTYFLNKKNFIQYFSFGKISSPGKEMKVFGIKENDSWIKTGISLMVIISSVTAIFMYVQLKDATVDWSALQSGIVWILLFSLTNSFGEEMIFRLGIVSPLKGLLSPLPIFLLSAILFGIPHLAGMPSGFIGATMAAILGLVLAKSLYETRGFFWAWTIHFIQDVIIIGSLFLLSTVNE